MAKFKVGEVYNGVSADIKGYKVKVHHIDGDESVLEVLENNSGNKYFKVGGLTQKAKWEDCVELITDYQPITPKVGEKYRVVKDVKDNTDTIHKKGTILEAISNYSSNSYPRQKWKSDQRSLIHFDSIHEFQLTTEYLELVEEATIKEDIIKPLKQKAMKALKKLTQSKEDRTLERAGFIDSCGEPTEKTTDILLAKLFVEKKDELVKMAEEELAEDKE